jgi:hypothetical protein
MDAKKALRDLCVDFCGFCVFFNRKDARGNRKDARGNRNERKEIQFIKQRKEA